MDSTFLTDRRQRRNLSRHDVAARLGVHPHSIRRWERRERLPGPTHIHALAESLAVDRAQLVAFFDSARPAPPAPAPVVRGSGLRWVRLQAGIPVRRIAEAAGVLPATVYNWEAGRAALPLDVVPSLAPLFGVEPGELVRALRSAPRGAPSSPQHPLRRLRHRTGLSQEHVATRIGASRKSVGAWERGQTPPLGAVRRLAAVYGVPVAAVARASGLVPPALLDQRAWTPGDLPEVLATLRAWSGLTQAGLAERLGCSKAAVRGWERGRSTPTPRLRLELEQLLGLAGGSLLRAFPARG